MKKRMLSLVVALALCLGLTVPTCAAGRTFTDVPAGAWYSEWVEKAVAGGLISGYSDGRFGPDDNVTYAQLAVMLVRALSSQGDIQSSTPWWMAYAEEADDYGLWEDTDMAEKSVWASTANQAISREQMAQMLYNAMDAMGTRPLNTSTREAAFEIKDYLIENSDFSDRNSHAVLVCYARKLLSGDANGYFHPKEPMTRSQAAVVMCRLFEHQFPSKRPDDAVGGRYNTNLYTVPADINKDGWITSAEVDAVLAQLKIDYPDGSPWGSDDHWNSPVFGGGSECAGFAFMVSDKIFGNLPRLLLQDHSQIRIGDVINMRTMEGNKNVHWSTAVSGVLPAGDNGKVGWPDGTVFTVDGNNSGKVSWPSEYWAGNNEQRDNESEGIKWVIYTRYPAE